MPYDYKRKQDCRQADGSKGDYVSKKKGAATQKCWKSQAAFKRAQAARHAQMEADEPNEPVDVEGDEEEQLTEKFVRMIIRRVLREGVGI